MSRGLDGDDPFEDEEYRKRIEQERAERAAEKAPLVIHMPAHSSSPTVAQRLEMACLQCGAGMIRGTQCRRCGAWCR